MTGEGGNVRRPTRTHSSSPSSSYTERRAATLETTCDDQKSKRTASENVWAEAEGDERTHRTHRTEWIREEVDESKLDIIGLNDDIPTTEKKRGLSQNKAYEVRTVL